VHTSTIRGHDNIKCILEMMLTLAGSSCIFEKALVADHSRFQKEDISTTINGVTTFVDVAIAETTAPTYNSAHKAGTEDGAAGGGCRQTKVRGVQTLYASSSCDSVHPVLRGPVCSGRC
jgi:hypothetical protein